MAIFSNLIPLPEPIQNQSSVSSLKQRLDWGEPALTIIDVRPRVLFNITHIMGSIPMPMDEPNNLTLASLELSRDIYIYAETNEQTARADINRATGKAEAQRLLAETLKAEGGQLVLQKEAIQAWREGGSQMPKVLVMGGKEQAGVP